MSGQQKITSFFNGGGEKRQQEDSVQLQSQKQPRIDPKIAQKDIESNKKEETRSFKETWKLQYLVVQSVDGKVQCLLCNSIIAAVKVNNCKSHYDRLHQADFDKKFPLDNNGSKARNAELNRLISERQQLSKQLKKSLSPIELSTKASFEIAWLMCKFRKPFSSGKFIKQVLQTVNSTLTVDFPEPRTQQKLAKRIDDIATDRRTVGRRIETLSEDVEIKLKTDLKNCLYFSICLDDSKDISEMPQLVVFVRYITQEFEVKGEMLFLCELKKQKRGVDINEKFKESSERFELDFSKLTGITTDGCPAMKGPKIGFVRTFLNEHPDLKNWVCYIHCFVHQEALVAKLLDADVEKPELESQKTTPQQKAKQPNKMQSKKPLPKKSTKQQPKEQQPPIQPKPGFNLLMKDVTKLINHLVKGDVKRFAVQFFEDVNETRKENGEELLKFKYLVYYCEVRWLSRARVLVRVCSLHTEIRQFLYERGELVNFSFLDDKKWIRNLYFLADVTKHLADLNKKMQGGGLDIHHFYSKIKAFHLFLKELPSQLETGDFTHFEWLKKERIEIDANEMTIYRDYLPKLSTRFDEMFQEFKTLEPAFLFYQSPFEFKLTDVSNLQATFHLSDKDKEMLSKEIVSLKANESFFLKKENIWITWKEIFKHDEFEICTKIVSLFGSTYLCESTFSILHFMKNKFRNMLNEINLENELRCSLTSFKPDFEKLTLANQCHPSHKPNYKKNSEEDSNEGMDK